MSRCSLVLFIFLLSGECYGTSLYDPKSFNALHEDKTAHRIGDPLTVLIFERTQASASAGDGSQSDLFLGGDASINEKNWDAGLNFGAGNASDASTNRNGFIRAQLTARIIEIDQFGALIVRGSQTITINDEIQKVTIEGKVRVEDISSENTIPSFRILDADIAVDGSGSVAEGSHKSLLSRIATFFGF